MTSEPASSAARLCAACGMCCNGVLFHSVLMQPGDSARSLAALGLKIKRKKGRAFFLQPCSVHRENHCAIYGHRPDRCRNFHCRQLLRVTSGETTEGDALENIARARDLAARVRALLARISGTNPNRALAQRCANALATPHRTSLHDELQSAMEELEVLLDREFRVKQTSIGKWR